MHFIRYSTAGYSSLFNGEHSAGKNMIISKFKTLLCFDEHTECSDRGCSNQAAWWWRAGECDESKNVDSEADGPQGEDSLFTHREVSTQKLFKLRPNIDPMTWFKFLEATVLPMILQTQPEAPNLKIVLRKRTPELYKCKLRQKFTRTYELDRKN